MYIYKITNILNNKCYIGQTINTIEERWKRHQQDALSGRLDTHFANAIRKYGVENFTLELLDTASSPEELTQKEHDWIIYYNSVLEGYNETDAISKSGGNTYKYKTKEELTKIAEKISLTKQGGLNVNATAVKCRNIKTQEEFHFNSQAEMQDFFNAPNHLFISRRCLDHIKSPYLNEWEIAYEDMEYGEAAQNPKQEKNLSRTSQIESVTVLKISTGEEKTFKTYSEAERYFEQKPRAFSSKASKKPKTFIYKEEYQITKHYKK